LEWILLSSEPELSKSRFFSISDGKIEPAAAGGNSGTANHPAQTIVDGKYEVLGVLGKGGMGVVYHARHLLLKKEVALKTFTSDNLTDEDRMRFEREAKAIAKLNHKNIVQVFDYGVLEDGVPYYTMEYLNGFPLNAWLKSHGPLKIDQALDIFHQLCNALDLAHSKGIVHRDLKPANIIMQTKENNPQLIDSVKLVDFGLASLSLHSYETQKLTSHGTVFGSPLYMSPEQSKGKDVTPSSDVYSLGCTFFEALTGNTPFTGNSALDVVLQHQRTKPPPLEKASGKEHFSQSLERLLASMLAKSPDLRQSSMDQVAKAIERIQEERRTITQIETSARAKSDKQQSGSLADDAAFDQEKKYLRTILPWIACLIIAAAGLITYALQNGFTIPKMPQSDKLKTTASRPLPMTDKGSEAPAATTEAKSTTKSRFSPRRFIEKGPDGRMWAVFKFAPGLDLGHFEFSAEKNQLVHEVEEVRWPVGMFVSFIPSPTFMQDPSNIDLFLPDQVSGLNFHDCLETQKGPSLLKKISTTTNLQVLNLSGADISDEDLKLLIPLKKMTYLDLSATKVTGANLAKLPTLRNIRSINFSDCVGARDLLPALKGDTALTDLFLDNQNLTKHDVKLIADLPNLNRLQAINTGLTNNSLAPLTGLKHLQFLKLNSCPIDGEARPIIEVLAQNGLKSLQLSVNGWSQEERAAMHKIVPQVIFAADGYIRPDSVAKNKDEIFDMMK